jgi:glutamyl-tRNA synthetase
VPMILGPDGEKLSKRHGSVSVMQYRDNGFLPEAMVNYLARLGWSHGDAEVFSRDELVEWFELDHISRSAARFDPQKLSWLNAHYIKQASDRRLAALARPFLERAGCNPEAGPPLDRVVGLLKERISTIEELADVAVYFYRRLEPSGELRAQHYAPETIAALSDLTGRLEAVEWSRQAISAALKSVAEAHKLKMPKVAMPLRVMVTGETQTPSVDAVLELLGREETLTRMRSELARTGL